MSKTTAAKQSLARPKAAALVSDGAADRKDLWTIIQEEMAAGGALGASGGGAEAKDDTTVVFAGAWRSGKSTLIQSFINKDKEDVPQPTTGLDYQIARISTTISSADASAASAAASASASSGGNSNGEHGPAAAAAVEVQEVQSTFQLWEIGGGRTMVRMTDICLTPESVQRAMAVIVVDLSKPTRVVDDLQFWLGALKAQIGACLKQNPRAAPALLDRARARFKAANGGDHKDLDKVDLFPIPLLIIAAKYDAFKEREKEWRGEAARVMARTLRCLAHANGASLLYTAAFNAGGSGAKASGGGGGGKLSLQAFRVRFKSFLMQQAWPKLASAASESSASDSKEQIVQSGCDFFERIGAAPPPHDNSRNLPAGWVAASAACFVDKSGNGGGEDDEDAAAAAVAGGDEADREPQIDAILAQKNDELARHLREAALKQKMDTIDLQQSS